jgi:hypothetical protein
METSLTIVDSLIPPITPPRAATLQPLYQRLGVARVALAGLREAHQDLADRLARLDLKALQSRLRPEFYAVAGRVLHTATELQRAFDNSNVSVDLRDALRGASTARSDGDFTFNVQKATKLLELYEAQALNVNELVHRLGAALGVLEAAGDGIFSDRFEIPKQQCVQFTTEPTVNTVA